MTSRVCLRSNPLIASFGVHNDIGNRQDLFRIRIGFSILFRESSPELGSDYGTKPSRSFHEETVPPYCPGNLAHPERVPQRVHQHASPPLVRNADRKPGLLRRGSRRASGNGRPSLCTGIGQHASNRLNGNVDQFRILLRRRSRWLLRLCSGIGRHAAHFLDSNVDQFRILLRRRSRGLLRLCSGIGRHAAHCLDRNFVQTPTLGIRSNGGLRALILIGRLPVRRDGQ
jgi:hypothetical protein